MLRRLAHFAANLLFFVSAVSAGFTRVRRGSNALAPSANAEKHCSVQWLETWTSCSPDGKQTRRYTVLDYPTRTGKQCPEPETRACVYPGSQTITVGGNDGTWSTRQCAPARRLLAYAGETHETFAMPPLCQYEPIKVTVGDVVVFKKSAQDSVTALPSQWHYNRCNFTDGGAALRADNVSTDTHLRYTIRQEESNKRLYIASARDNACSRGQRVLISVDDFKQGTLAEVIDLIENKKSYTTEEGAIGLIERIWCFEGHCPDAAMGWYEGNSDWSKARCKADAYSLLGFVYRKRPTPQFRRAEEHYMKALELNPQHCEAASYVGELYLQIEHFEEAAAAYSRLQALESSLFFARSESTGACEKALHRLSNAWTDKGWCPPPANANTPCIAASATTVADRAYVSTTAKGASRAARPQAPAGVWLGCCLVGVISLLSAL